MTEKYLVVPNAVDEKVQHALNEISAAPDKITLADFIQRFNEIAKPDSLNLPHLQELSTKEEKAKFLNLELGQNAAIYSIEPDNTINLRVYYGPNVNPIDPGNLKYDSWGE